MICRTRWLAQVDPKDAGSLRLFLPRKVGALTSVAIIGVMACGSNFAMSADASAWVGRWAIDAETCQNDGYDMLIEPDHFEIWEQACDIKKIKKWSINGSLATLTMRCFNEGTSATQERVQLLLRGDVIEINPAGGPNFTHRTMVRCG
jgi:hypothetical protein